MLAPLVQLGDVVNLIGGGTPSKSNEGFYGGDIPWATVRDMKQEQLSQTEFQISEEAVKKSSTNIIEAGNIITATRVGLGKVCILQQDTAINQDLKALIPKDGRLDKQYLFWWLKSVAHVIEAAGTGATVKGVKIPFVKALEIPLPSITEQKRIVAILDQAFSDINKARALTEQNLKNARELFESYLQKVFSQRGEGWTVEPLENLVTNDCSLSYGIVQPGNEFEDGLPIVRPTDLSREVIDLNGLKLIDPSKAEGYMRTVLQGGELLVCVRGSTGTTSIASEQLAGANVTRGVVPIRFNSERVSQRFGYYQFVSPLIQAQIQAGTYGAALMQINIRDLRKIEVAVPPLLAQNEIVNKLDSVKPDLLKVEKLYISKLNAFDELKKALLQKAFSGELKKDSEEAVA